MATITGLTAVRMLEIEGESVVDGEIISGNLWLTKHNGEKINAGPVIGPVGPQGPTGPAAISSVPGEVKLWSGSALPAIATYGKWVWADGGIYPVASHPIAAGHIAPAWRTAHGASDPGGANFRVPDLRGLVPAGMDAMPGGARANRMTRSVAITIAAKTGEETHVITLPEMAAHNHGGGNHAHTFISQGMNVQVGGERYSFFLRDYHESDQPYINPSGTIIGTEGGNGGHENVQPTVMVPYIVYLDG